ncbi:hypothetical protein DdX_12732 [Ditylenchus destructor]|uniref:Uncharacterized protein n=1 Tax=Ditylenchus destructor TaxID=166010 RepID=A0AAD4MV43_9BILA|nr:hypothetical protein DdX_12732 [Ditylenchus destructor]
MSCAREFLLPDMFGISPASQEESEANVAYHWQVVEACVDFEYKMFFGEDTVLKYVNAIQTGYIDHEQRRFQKSSGRFE